MLDRAPESVEACAELDIEQHLGHDLAQFIAAIHQILPGGILELVDYLPEEKRKDGWGCGVC